MARNDLLVGIAGAAMSRRRFVLVSAGVARGRLSVRGQARAQTATPAAGTPTVPADLLAACERTATTAEGWPLRVVLAVPAYLRAAGLEREPALTGTEQSLTILTVRRHGGALATGDDPFTIGVRLDGGEAAAPAERRPLRDDGAERSDLFVFSAIAPAVLAENHLFEVLVPAPSGAPPLALQWITPIVVPDSSATPAAVPAVSPAPTEVPVTDLMETAIPSGDIETC